MFTVSIAVVGVADLDDPCARGYYGTVWNYFPYYISLKTYRTVISYVAKIPYVTVRYGIFSVP